MTRILLVEDSPTQAEMLRTVLAGAGFDVTVKLRPEQVLSALVEWAPDLVVSDVMMPRLNGFGLLKELRADPALNTIPVVLLSARAGEESR